ncbi:unnamed protein product [Urochloa humidicola]
MAGSAPLGDGRPVWGTDDDGSSRTRAPQCLAGAPLPHGISGDGHPPSPSATTSESKKRRSTFVARPHDRQLLGPAASYLIGTSTPGSIQRCAATPGPRHLAVSPALRSASTRPPPAFSPVP